RPAAGPNPAGSPRSRPGAHDLGRASATSAPSVRATTRRPAPEPNGLCHHPGVPRRTAAETRQLLLDTGVEMLYETGISPPVAHIRLQNVLRRAGLTTGAAYRIWANQEDFQLDLAEEATLRRHDERLPIEPTQD